MDSLLSRRVRHLSGYADYVQAAAMFAVLFVVAASLALVEAQMAAALLVAGTAGIVAVARPRLGLWLVLLTFPVHPLLMRLAQVDLGFAGSSLVILSAWKEIGVVGMVVGLLLKAPRMSVTAMARQGVRWLALPDYMAAALILLVGVGFILNPTILALNQARLLLFPIGVYIGVRADLIPQRRLFVVLLAVGTAIAAFGIIQGSLLGWPFVERYIGTPAKPRPDTFTQLLLEGPRASGTMVSPNDFAFLMIVYLALSMALLCRLPSPRKGWLVPVLAIVAVALAVAFSRSALLAGGAALGVPVVLMARYSVNPRRSAASLAAALGTAFLLSAFIYLDRGGVAFLANTARTIGGSDEISESSAGEALDPSTVDHIASLSEGAQLLSRHPLGVGLGNVGPRSVPGTTVRPQYIIESWFLAMGLTLGWIGLAWAIAWPVVLARTAYRVLAEKVADPLSAIALSSLAVAVFVIGLVLPTLMEPHAAMFPWVVCGLAVVELGRRGIASHENSGGGPAANR